MDFVSGKSSVSAKLKTKPDFVSGKKIFGVNIEKIAYPAKKSVKTKPSEKVLKAVVWKKATAKALFSGQIAPARVEARHASCAIFSSIAKNPNAAMAVKLKISQITPMDFIDSIIL